MGKTTKHWQRAKLDDVMNYFALAYKGKIVGYEYWIDTHKGEVVFRLDIAEPTQPSEKVLDAQEEAGDVILRVDPIAIVEPEQPTVVIAGQPRDETFHDAVEAGRANAQMQLLAPTSQETARFAQAGYTITKRWRVKLAAPYTLANLVVGCRYVADNLEGEDARVAVYYRDIVDGAEITSLIMPDTFHEIFEIEDTLEP